MGEDENNILQPIWCDICGEDIANERTREGRCRLWYCRHCKRRGHRFEVCMACHAVEVLQGEGKHAGSGPHPHYLRHQHCEIVRVKDLRLAYPFSPHIRRTFCDYCGVLMHFRSEDSCIYLCPRCPEEHGLRFELCEQCALSLREQGHRIRYALGAAGI